MPPRRLYAPALLVAVLPVLLSGARTPATAHGHAPAAAPGDVPAAEPGPARGVAAPPPAEAEDPDLVTRHEEADPLEDPDAPVDEPPGREPRLIAGPPGITTADFRTLVESVLARPEFAGTNVGVRVVRPADGRTIYAYNADAPLVPASLAKLVTTAAALDRFGPAHRFRTRFRRDAGSEIDDGVLKGPLYLVGDGDPLITHERVAEAARGLYDAGVREVRGPLVIDADCFDDDLFGPGWDYSKSDDAYTAPVGCLAVDFNTYVVRVAATKPGRPARVWTEPEIPSLKLERVRVKTVRGRAARIRMKRAQGRGGAVSLAVEGTLGVGRRAAAVRKRHGTPVVFAAETFAAALKAQGVIVRGGLRYGRAPANAATVYDLTSLPLRHIIEASNKISQNVVTDALFKSLGRALGGTGSWRAGREAVQLFLDRVGFAREEYAFVNGSGLTLDARVSAARIVDLLVYMTRRPDVFPEYAASLGIAGRDGTLRRRFAESDAAGWIRAKTGSLDHVSNLAGYVFRPDGEVFAFALMITGADKARFKADKKRFTAAQDEIASALMRLALP